MSNKNLNKALFAVQKELGLTLTKDANNPFFKSSYLSLPNLSDAIQPLFQKHGLLLQQPPVSMDGKTYIKTKITHVESGESDETLTEVTVAKPNDPQAMGSGITYMRRFVLGAALGIAAEDDDGEAAMGRGNKATTQAKVQEAVKASNTTVTASAPVATTVSTAPAKQTSSFRVKKPDAAAKSTSSGNGATDVEGWS